MRLSLHPEALAEPEAAVRLLERDRPPYGTLIFNAVEAKVAEAAQLPESGEPLAGFEQRWDVRASAVDRLRHRARRLCTARPAGS